MRIGLPKEIKDHEYRVGLTPAGVQVLVQDGHELLVQRSAGDGSGFTDDEYLQAGATMIDTAPEVFKAARMIIKVKEPLLPETEMMHEDQILFTYLHLAPLAELTDALLEKRITGIAYETVTDRDGGLPLLSPMSEVAGRMASLVGAYYLQRAMGGRGTLLSGVPGVPPGDVIIIGGGIVGLNSAKVAIGLGARVTILDTNVDRLRYIDDIYEGRITTLASNAASLAGAVQRADLLVGAVLLPGRSAPMLVTRDMLPTMKPGSVIVDVAVDQGGCVETTRPTTHSDPVFEVDGIVHYCVANMPGAVPRTSTFALSNVTLPYARRIAHQGVTAAVRADAGLAEGVNTHKGQLTSSAVGESQGRESTDVSTLL